jgi:hypothetical protein
MDIRTELARIDRCKKHTLADILLFCIIAMVCGVENVEDIVFSVRLTRTDYGNIGPCPTGYPASILFCGWSDRIDHRKFEGCFLSWACGYFREQVNAGSIIAVDGKTMRGRNGKPFIS